MSSGQLRSTMSASAIPSAYGPSKGREAGRKNSSYQWSLYITITITIIE